MIRLSVPALAGLLLASLAPFAPGSAAADSLSCQTTNGRTLCVHGTGSMNLSCSTVNGRTECSAGNRRLDCRTSGNRTDCEAVADDTTAAPPPRGPRQAMPRLPDGMTLPGVPQQMYAAPVEIRQNGQRLRVRAGGVDIDLDQ